MIELSRHWPFQPQRIQYPNDELFGPGALIWTGSTPNVVTQSGVIRSAALPQYKGRGFGKLGVSGAWNAASGDGLRFPNWRPNITSAMTCFVVAAPVSGSSNAETAFALSPDASYYGKYPSVAFQFNVNPYGSLGYPGQTTLTFCNTTSEYACWAYSGGIDGGLHCWACSIDTVDSYMLCDGVDITYPGAGQPFTGTMTRPEQQFFIGAHPTYDGARTMTSPLYLVVIVPRKMSQAEAAKVSQQLLRNLGVGFSKRPKRVFVTAGGGGGDVTVALSGQAATASAGTLVPSSSKALSGQAATISAGTLTPSISKALSGTAVTVSAGTLTPSRTVPLSGQAVTVSAGTITYNAGSDITLALSGAEVTASAGTLVPSSSVSLAGSAVTASAGTVVPTFPRTLSGSAVTVSAGTVTPSMSVPLVGQAVTVSAGTLTYAPEGDVTVALTGEAVTVSAGTLTASGGDSNQASGGFAGGWHAIVKGKRVFGSRDQLIRLMQAEAEEDAKEAAEEKPRAKAKPKPKKVIEEVTEVIEENTVGFIPAPPEVVRRDETAIRNMLSRIYADAYRAEFERQAAIKRRMEDDEDDEAILLFL